MWKTKVWVSLLILVCGIGLPRALGAIDPTKINTATVDFSYEKALEEFKKDHPTTELEKAMHDRDWWAANLFNDDYGIGVEEMNILFFETKCMCTTENDLLLIYTMAKIVKEYPRTTHVLRITISPCGTDPTKTCFEQKDSSTRIHSQDAPGADKYTAAYKNVLHYSCIGKRIDGPVRPATSELDAEPAYGIPIRCAVHWLTDARYVDPGRLHFNPCLQLKGYKYDSEDVTAAGTTMMTSCTYGPSHCNFKKKNAGFPICLCKDKKPSSHCDDAYDNCNQVKIVDEKDPDRKLIDNENHLSSEMCAMKNKVCKHNPFLGLYFCRFEDCKDENPCLNDGTCSYDKEDTAVILCDCPKVISSSGIEMEKFYPGGLGRCNHEDKCVTGTHVCLNGGTCKHTRAVDPPAPPTPSSTKCICPTDATTGKMLYYGDLFCEHEDPCVTGNRVCQNGGKCMHNNAEHTTKCNCATMGGQTAYYGLNCQFKDRCVLGTPCQNGGTCQQEYDDETEQEPKCNCLPGYKGDSCDKKNFCITELMKWTMKNVHCIDKQGMCLEDGSTEDKPSCECKGGFWGDRCEKTDFCFKADADGMTPCTHADLDCVNEETDFRCGPAPAVAAEEVEEIDNVYINGVHAPQKVIRSKHCKGGWYGLKCDLQNKCFTGKGGKGACNKLCGTHCCHITSMTPEKSTSYFPYECHCTEKYKDEKNGCDKETLCPRKCPMGDGYKDCIEDYDTMMDDIKCVCKKGYSGEQCEVEDFCVTKWIEEDEAGMKINLDCGTGTCEEGSTAHKRKCTCEDNGIMVMTPLGDYCKEDKCFSILCDKTGTMMKLTEPTWDGKCCVCHEKDDETGFFIGDRCEKREYCKQKNICNGHPCKEDEPENSYTCVCPPDRKGRHCEYVNKCGEGDGKICGTTENTCEYKGHLTYKCNCGEDWYEDSESSVKPNCYQKKYCNTVIPRCSVSGTGLPCEERPKEKDEKDRRYCPCKKEEFYYGEDCGQQDACHDDFKSKNCNIAGIQGCIHRAGSPPFGPYAECICKDEYYHGNTGKAEDKRCDYLDPCKKKPKEDYCTNRGKCIHFKDEFTCSCEVDAESGKPKYHGTACEFEDPCVTQKPCQNGGTCHRIEGAEGYTCNCPAEFPSRLNKDCKSRDPCHPKFTTIDKCEHGGVCIRIGDFELQCNCKGTGYVGSRCGCLETVVSFYYPTAATVSVGEPNLFIVVVEKLGEKPTIHIDMGDGFKFSFHPGNLRSVDETDVADSVLTTEGIQALKRLPNRKWKYFAFVYTFRNVGPQSVTMSVINDCVDKVTNKRFNLFNTLIIDTREALITRCLPKLKLRNCAHDTEVIPVYERKARFVITTSYYSDCPPGDHFKFRWQLYSLTEQHPFPQPSNNVKALEDPGITEHLHDDNKHIVFQAGKLVRGTYWIEILVYTEDAYGMENGQWKADWCYFKVENSPPFAFIKGGRARTISNSAGSVELDASGSRDETEPSQSHKLDFRWHWRYASDATTVKNKCSSLRSACKDNEATIRVTLKPNLVYIFSVDVRSVRPPGEPTMSSTATQEVRLAAGGLKMTTECLKNCERFNPGDRVKIRCSCEDEACKSGLNYAHNKNGLDARVTPIRANPTSGEYLIELGYGLADPEPTWRDFTCKGILKSNKQSGVSSFGIRINKPPKSGLCKILTKTDERVIENPIPTVLHSFEFLRDSISLRCVNFQDPNAPLTYEVHAKIVGSTDYILETGILLFYDVYPVVDDIFLPLGKRTEFSKLRSRGSKKGDEFRVEVSVVVSDSFGLAQPPDLRTKEFVQVLDPLPKTRPPPSGTLLPKHIKLGLKEVVQKVMGSKDVEGQASVRSKAGDHQGALHLVLTFLYSRKENKLLQDATAMDLRRLGDVVGEVVSRVILHSYLIVKQVIQVLYLYSEISNELSEAALKNFAEQLIRVASYFRKYVVYNEEVIFTRDIVVLASAAKHAAELVMTAVKQLGDEEIRKLNLEKEKGYELKLHHLYRKERDYFLEEDDIFTPEYNSSREDVATEDVGLEGHIEILSTICQKAYQCIIDLMLAVSEREVHGSQNLIDPADQKVFARITLRRLQDMGTKNDFDAGPGSKGTITIPGQAVTLISQQIGADEGGSKDIQLHVIESNIDPYFGDIANSVKTSIMYILINNDKMVKNHYQFIRIRENLTEPILVHLPLIEDPLTLVDKTSEESKPIISTVQLIRLEEIDHSNKNVKIHHLTLIHGSQFYVRIKTESTDPKFDSVEYMVAAVRNYRPNINDFCDEDVKVGSRVRRMSGADLTLARFTAEREEEIHTHKGKTKEEEFEEEYLDYYVGIWPFDESGNNDYGTELTYSVRFVQLSCLSRNEDENEWSGQGCEVDAFSDMRLPGSKVNDHFLVCRCHHLSIFAGSILVPPNRIDFIQDFDLGLTLRNNWIVFVTVCLILGAYGICHGFCLYLDRRDKVEHVGITIMCDIGENFGHSFYLVNVITGSRISSGTTASVSMRIYGSNGRSQAYVLKDPSLKVLNRGGNDSFIISSPFCLGELEKVMIWHDNTGSRPGWYLRKIIIKDVKMDKEWYFFCGTWFSVTYEKDPTIIRTLFAATEAEKKAWKRRFVDRLVDEYNNSHLWFSVFFRLPTSNFTRCQRLVCSVGILTSYLLINIMYHGYPTNDHSHIFEVGGITINYLQIYLGFVISFFSLPFGIILIMLFQRIRKRHILTVVIWKNRTKHMGQVDYNEAYLFAPQGPEKHVVPVIVGRVEGEEENTEPFSIPDTDIKRTEAWIMADTRGHGLRPIHQREPDAFVHRMDETEDLDDGNHLLRIGRHTLAAGIRAEDPSSFIYEGHGSFEEQFDADLAERIQRSQHPWTRYRARDIHAIEAEKKKELPTVQPVVVVESDGKEHDILYDGIAIELYEMRPVAKKCCYLPWPFIWVSWTIALLTIAATCFFTVWAGFQMGPIRSYVWLNEVALAFIQSVVITQPLRILLVGLLMSLIFRKLHSTDEDRFQILIKEGNEDIGNHKRLDIKPFRPARSIPPLSGAVIYGLRVKARKRNELKRGLYSIIIHIIVMFFIYFVALENHTDEMYEVTAHIKTMLDLRSDFDNCRNCDNEFANIRTQGQVFDYLTTKFINIINPRFDYNGEVIPPPKDLKFDSAMMYDDETMIIGIPRLRQKRIVPHECNIHENIKKYYMGAAYNPLDPRTKETMGKISCTGPFDSVYEDKGTYNPFWEPVVNNKRSWSSSNDVWSYKTQNQTKAITLRGLLGSYGGGGYVAELGMEYRKTKGMLNYLNQTGWMDIFTRALFIEVTAVIPNVNIYVDIVLIIERSPSRAYTTSSQIYPLKMSYNDDEEFMQKWIAFCYVCICLFLIGLSIMLVKNVIHSWRYTRFSTFKQIGLWIDFFIVISCLASIAVAFKLHHVSELARTRLRDALVNEFVCLQEVSYWDFVHTSAFAISLSLCIVKLWKLLVLAFERFYILSLTLKLSSGYLFGFLFLVSLLTTAFAFWGVLEFGSSMEEFHSVPHAFLELMNELLNPSFYHSLHGVHSIVGPIYFVIFGFTICLVGLNLFIALLTHAYYEAKEIARQRGPMLTYWSYVKRSKWYIRLFAWTAKENPNDKLVLNPLRLKEMERVTKEFLREVVKQHQFTRMNEMKEFANNEMLKGTGMRMISKAEKRRRTRLAMNTTVQVSEQRMEEMRTVTVMFLKRAIQREMTGEEVTGHARFNKAILEARLQRLQDFVVQVTRGYQIVMALEDELDKRRREEAQAREEQRQREAAEREARAAAMALRRRRPSNPDPEARRPSNPDPEARRPSNPDAEARRPSSGSANHEAERRMPPAEPAPQPYSWRRPSASSTSESWRSIGSGHLPMTHTEYRQRKEDLEHPRGQPPPRRR